MTDIRKDEPTTLTSTFALNVNTDYHAKATAEDIGQVSDEGSSRAGPDWQSLNSSTRIDRRTGAISASIPDPPKASSIRHHLDGRAGGIAERIAHLPADALLSTSDTASWLGVSTQFLSIGRSRGYGPEFVRLSPTVVRYRISDIRRWLGERTHQRTVEFTGGKRLSDQHRANMIASRARRRAGGPQ